MMNITAQANRTLAMRDAAHTAQDALTAIMASLISANGRSSEDAIWEFEQASADLVNTLRS